MATARDEPGADYATSLQQRARALADPTRYRLFHLVADAPSPIAVAELATALGVHPNAVRQHLAKLTAAGLVVEQTEDRHTPGRPRLLYTVSGAPGPWSNAPSPYERLSLILLDAMRTGDSPRQAGHRIGTELAADAPGGGDPVDTIVGVIAREGFDPATERHGNRFEIHLQTCPYAAAARSDAGVVCELHRGLVEGLAAATGGVEVVELAVRPPASAGCRLHLHTVDVASP